MKIKHIDGLSGQEEQLALKQLEQYKKDEEQFLLDRHWDRVFEIWEEQREMDDDEAEDLAQAIGYI